MRDFYHNNTQIDIGRISSIDTIHPFTTDAMPSQDKNRVILEYYNSFDAWELNAILKVALIAKENGIKIEPDYTFTR